MTVKVYKKNVHWYFKFKNTEIGFNKTGDLFCDILQSFLDTNTLYFNVLNEWSSNVGAMSFSYDSEFASYYKFKLYGRLVYDIIKITGYTWQELVSINIPKDLLTEEASDSIFWCGLK